MLQTYVNPGSATVAPLLAGTPGTEQTIGLIRSTVSEGLKDPFVRQTAGAIVRRVPAHNEAAEVRAVYDWVARRIRFTKDPVGKETVSSARWTLTHGFGDCDDVNGVLLPTLLGVIGYRTRLVTIASHPMAPDQFSHVYAEVLLDGRWVPVDAARRGASFGRAPERVYRKRVWSLENAGYQDVGLAGMGISAADIIPQITRSAQDIITAIRFPGQQLPSSPGDPGSTAYTPHTPSASTGARTEIPWIPIVVIGGALFLASRKGRG